MKKTIVFLVVMLITTNAAWGLFTVMQVKTAAQAAEMPQEEQLSNSETESEFIERDDSEVEFLLEEIYTDDYVSQYIWAGPDPNTLTREKLIQYYYVLSDTLTYDYSVLVYNLGTDGSAYETYEQALRGEFPAMEEEPAYADPSLPEIAYYMFGTSVGEYRLEDDGLYHKIRSWGWANNEPLKYTSSGKVAVWGSSNDLPPKEGQGLFAPSTIDPSAGYLQCPMSVIQGPWMKEYSN